MGYKGGDGTSGWNGTIECEALFYEYTVLHMLWEMVPMKLVVGLQSLGANPCQGK